MESRIAGVEKFLFFMTSATVFLGSLVITIVLRESRNRKEKYTDETEENTVHPNLFFLVADLPFEIKVKPLFKSRAKVTIRVFFQNGNLPFFTPVEKTPEHLYLLDFWAKK